MDNLSTLLTGTQMLGWTGCPTLGCRSRFREYRGFALFLNEHALRVILRVGRGLNPKTRYITASSLSIMAERRSALADQLALARDYEAAKERVLRASGYPAADARLNAARKAVSDV